MVAVSAGQDSAALCVSGEYRAGQAELVREGGDSTVTFPVTCREEALGLQIPSDAALKGDAAPAQADGVGGRCGSGRGGWQGQLLGAFRSWPLPCALALPAPPWPLLASFTQVSGAEGGSSARGRQLRLRHHLLPLGSWAGRCPEVSAGQLPAAGRGCEEAEEEVADLAVLL